MKILTSLFVLSVALHSLPGFSVPAEDSDAQIVQEVYIEVPFDTDEDGVNDKIYVEVKRPNVKEKLPTKYTISPYFGGVDTSTPMHNVDLAILPQDEFLKAVEHFLRNFTQDTHSLKIEFPKSSFTLKTWSKDFRQEMLGEPKSTQKYIVLRADSIGTGHSTGCPTIGDMTETLAAKSVIDWINGREKAFTIDGEEVVANWATGNVGMIGVSYNGTLPTMVASTGVEGLKAIVPIAAISNWYDYYRSNGLVVAPGGFQGEDADVLARFVMKKGSCKSHFEKFFANMGRENGDYNKFWQDRNYVPFASNIKAATFIVHGQADWNVRQRQAIMLWEAMEDSVPKKMFLHKGKHSYPDAHNLHKKVDKWLDHFVAGVENDILDQPRVEVEYEDGSLLSQNEWPSENTQVKRLYFNEQNSLSDKNSNFTSQMLDSGKNKTLENILENYQSVENQALLFVSEELEEELLLSGTPRVSLKVSVLNRKAANLSVSIVEIKSNGDRKIITRGWADPQNHRNLEEGELLSLGQYYPITFNLEPKQYVFAKFSKLGVMISSTDFEHTLRPDPGTKLSFNFGEDTFIELNLSK